MGRQLQHRIFNRKVLVAVLIFTATWTIYVKLFRHTLQQKAVEIVSNDDWQAYYEAYLKDISSTETEERQKLNSTDDPVVYPLDSRYIPKTSPRTLQKDLHTKQDRIKIYIKKLKKMLKGNVLSSHVEFEEDFLRAYITSSNFNISEAFIKINNFLNLRIEHDEIFHSISFDFTQNPAYRFITLLPHRNTDGSAILYFQVGKWEPGEVSIIHLKRLMFMIFMQELRNPITQANGFSTIYDFKDIGFKHYELISFENRRLLSHVYYEVLPGFFAGVHLVNLNFFASMLMPLIKRILPSYIDNIFFVHSSPDELVNFFPVSTLPAEYGGELTEYYAADWMRRANEQNDNYPPGGQKNVF